MMLGNRIVKALFLCLFLAFAACSAAPRQAQTYTNNAGAVIPLENDRESCTHSCNAEYDRCNETSAAQRPVGRGQLTAIFGGRADCKEDLRPCLAMCKAR